jgi:flagellar protein FlgJ
MSNQASFIASIAEPVQRACAGSKIFPSVCMAQAILETGWGKAKIGNNLFGIKAKGKPNKHWDGSYVESPTIEYYNGVKTRVVSKFRAYKSIEDSIRDHNELFNLSRYDKVRAAATPEEQARAVKTCGYATDPSYADKLINLITKYNLKQYD